MSIQTRDAIQQGDEDKARRHSNTARALAIASIVCGMLAIIVVVVLQVVVNSTASYGNYYG